jgi:hypothetical protein
MSDATIVRNATQAQTGLPALRTSAIAVCSSFSLAHPTSTDSIFELNAFDFLLPVPTFAEKNGTMINFKEMKRDIRAGKSFGNSSRHLADWSLFIASL